MVGERGGERERGRERHRERERKTIQHNTIDKRQDKTID
jgi:hypothetical protein